MEHKIAEAFRPIRAEEALKARTLENVLEAAARRRRLRVKRLSLCAAAGCCCLLLAVLCGMYFTPTSVISIDVNPSLELTVNRFDRVIAVNGYQEDGEALAASLNLLHLSYSQAVDRVVTSQAVTECLARGEWLSIAVVEMDEAQGEEILQYVSHCTAGTQNVSCHAVAREEVAQAHDHGLSYGKYQVYLDICAQGGTLTAQEAAAMTMRELRELLDQLQEDGLSAAGEDQSGSQGGQNGWQGQGFHGRGHHGC